MSGQRSLISAMSNPLFPVPRSAPSRHAVRRSVAAGAVAAAVALLLALPAAGDSPPASQMCVSPEFMSVPQDVTVIAGQPASFAGSAPVPCSIPPVPYGNAQWLVSTDGGSSFAVVPGSATALTTTGHASSSFTIPVTSTAMNGWEYELEFVAAGGATQNVGLPATLTVVAPTATTTTTTSTAPVQTSVTTTTSATTTTTSHTASGGVSAYQQVVPKKPLTRAQKLAAALKACARHRRTGQRSACAREARRRYGPKPKRK